MVYVIRLFVLAPIISFITDNPSRVKQDLRYCIKKKIAKDYRIFSKQKNLFPATFVTASRNTASESIASAFQSSLLFVINYTLRAMSHEYFA